MLEAEAVGVEQGRSQPVNFGGAEYILGGAEKST